MERTGAAGEVGRGRNKNEGDFKRKKKSSFYPEGDIHRLS
jgi:hypothetical protein